MKTQARVMGIPLDRLRKAIIFERFLARLVVVGGERWVLKGGLAMNCRKGDFFRPSKDIDVAHIGNLAQASEDFVAATKVKLEEEDYFSFQVRYLGDIKVGEEAHGNFHLDAYLGGKLFDEASIDLAFEPEVIGQGTQLPLPSLLGFSGLKEVVLEVVPVARHLADKVDAYLRGRINERTLSSRERDLADLVVIASWEGLVAGRLREEFEVVLNVGEGYRIPDHLPEPPTGWGRQYSQLAKELKLDQQTVEEAYSRAAQFLDPLLMGAISDEAKWDPKRQEWEEPELI
jgi:hypothetical protein